MLIRLMQRDKFLPRKLSQKFWSTVELSYRILRFFTRPTQPNLDKEGIKRILVVRPDYLGDMIVFIPTLRGIRQAFPKAHITLWASSIGKEIAKIINGIDFFDNFIIFGRWEIEKETKLKDLWRLFWALRKENFDLIISSTTTGFFTHLLVGLTSAQYKIGFDNTRWKIFYSHLIQYDGNKPEVQHNLDILHVLGIQLEDTEVRIRVTEKDKTYANNFLHQNGVNDEDFLVGLHVGTKQPCNQWEPDNWAILGDRLMEKHGAKLVITGGSNDREYTNKVLSLMHISPIDAVGKLTLKQLCALIEKCKIFISHDTGPMHLSVALSVPTIGLFGKENPKRWGYPENSNFVALQKDVRCRPCDKIECESRKCMKLITVEDVIRAVLTINRNLHEL